MQSEVRKVLESMRGNGWGAYRFWNEIDAAERADAAKREEPVRKAVAELVARWSTHYVPIDAAVMVRRLLAELNAIIATKLESQPATSEPSVTFGESPKATLPAGKPADEHIRAIAAMAVRDAMPDVIDKLACMFGEAGFSAVANAFRKHAAKLRKERGV